MSSWGMTPTRRLPGRFWRLIGATFLGFLGFGTVLPRLAPHVRLDLGGSDRTVGFVIGTFSVVALCSRIFAGRLADRKGRKRAFLTGLLAARSPAQRTCRLGELAAFIWDELCKASARRVCIPARPHGP